MKATQTKAFQRNNEVITTAIYTQLKSEGVEVENFSNEIGEISMAYLLGVQCVWYRLTNDKKVETFLRKYEDTVELAKAMIQKYGFQELVYTYRSNYTNLYQVTNKDAREYKLSKESYMEFLQRVQSGNLQVIAKTPKAKARKQAPKAQAQVDAQNTNKFLSSLLDTKTEKMSIKNMRVKSYGKHGTNTYENVNKLAKQVTPIAKKQAPKKASTLTGWHQTKIENTQENDFVRITLNDETKVYCKIVELLIDENNFEESSIVVFVKTNNETYQIDLQDIATIESYTSKKKAQAQNA